MQFLQFSPFLHFIALITANTQVEINFQISLTQILWSLMLKIGWTMKKAFKADVGVETGYETMIKLNYLIWWKLLKFNWFKLLNAKLLRKAVIWDWKENVQFTNIFMWWYLDVMIMTKSMKISWQQARKPRSYASSKLRLTKSLTWVKCRATSVAKNMS